MSKIIDYDAPNDGVDLVRADEVDSIASNWHMKGWLPEGELVILGGDGGAGKTLIAMDWIATLSNGGTRRGIFPDGTPAQYGSALIWSCEDDWNRTLKPRLDAVEANYRKIFFVGDTKEFGSSRSFDFKKDLPGLVKQIEQVGDVKILVIDTVMEVVSGGGTNAKKVRQDLTKLVEIAHKYRVTVIGIAHLVKDSKKGDLVKSLVGSQAFSNLARHVLIAMRVELPDYEEEGPSVGVLVRAKSNIGKTGGGRLYEIHPAWVNDRDGREIDTSRLIWHGKVLPASPSDLREWAASKKSELASSPRNRAQEFLMRLLADGPMPVREINALAEEDGITPKMLRNAKEKLGVVSERMSNGRRDVWHEWALPADAIGDPACPLDADSEELGQPRQPGQPGQPGQPQETYELGNPSAMQKLFEGYMTKNGKSW